MEPLSQHRFYKETKDFLKRCEFSSPSSSNSTFVMASDTQRIERTNQPCHMGFHPNQLNYEIATLSASGIFHDPKDKELTDCFINWILDPKKSPWRKIIQDKSNYEVIFGDDGNYRGIILSPYINQAVSWKFIRNFFVALRYSQEYSGQLPGFYNMVQEGIDPRDAYLLSKCITWNKRYSKYMIIHRFGWHNGVHWPITSQGLDWDKYWNGSVSEPGPFPYEFSGFFMTKGTKPIFGFEESGSEPEEIIKRYFTWKDQDWVKKIEDV